MNVKKFKSFVKTLLLTITLILSGVGVSLFITAQLAVAQDFENEVIINTGLIADGFGYAVAISGDYALVGTRDDETNSDIGTAYIFKRDDECNWIRQAKLDPSDGDPNDMFGYAVALSGDYAIIGAYGDDDNGGGAGAVYIFEKPAEGWTDMTETAKLTVSDTNPGGDQFGFSVAIFGEYIVVGAPRDDVVTGTATGSAYIFHREGGIWTQQAKLVANDKRAWSWFGSSVDISGSTAIVGAYEAAGNAYSSGAAYIFHMEGDTWTQQAKFIASDGVSTLNNQFGFAVAITDDYAFVGDWADNAHGVNSGALYLFQKPETGWEDATETLKLFNSGNDIGDRFGQAISVSGDYAIIGATGYSDDQGADGAAYIFRRDGDTWIEQIRLTASDSRIGFTDGSLGYKVGISGNYAITAYHLNSAYIYGPTVCPSACGSAELTFQNWAFTIDGITYEKGGAVLPDYVDTSTFDWDTGLGTIDLLFEPGTVGDFSIQTSFDYLFSCTTPECYTFSSETTGTPGDNQLLGFDFDEDEYQLTAALGWTFSLAHDTDWAKITFVLGDTLPGMPYSVFSYTSVSDAGSFSIASGIESIPEPSMILLFGCGLIGVFVLARRRLKKK